MRALEAPNAKYDTEPSSTGSPIANASVKRMYIARRMKPFANPSASKCDATVSGSEYDVSQMNSAAQPSSSANLKGLLVNMDRSPMSCGSSPTPWRQGSGRRDKEKARPHA